jgi:hypothetical protein
MLRADRRSTAAEMVVFLHGTVLTTVLARPAPPNDPFDAARAELLAAAPTIAGLLERQSSRDYVRLIDRVMYRMMWPDRLWHSLVATHLLRVRRLAKSARRLRGRDLAANVEYCAAFYADGMFRGATIEPLDRLRFKLVADGMTWVDADRAVRAAVADPFERPPDVAR